MSGSCSVCGRALRASSGIGPKCARKLGVTAPPPGRPARASPRPEIHPDQTAIPVQPTLPKEK